MVGDILQPTHLLFVLVIALLVLGPKRLPEVGKTLGSGIRDFRSAINGESTPAKQEEPEYIYSPPDEPAATTDTHADADAEPVGSGAIAVEDAPSGDAPPPLSVASEPVAPEPVATPASAAEPVPESASAPGPTSAHSEPGA